MLRFILPPAPLKTTNLYFNTSHVKVYLSELSSFFLELLISIHLMLRFIPLGYSGRQTYILISIHLMLRFIWRSPQSAFEAEHYFNTSHVKVYRPEKHLRSTTRRYFNTSHVKVYLAKSSDSASLIFISIHLMLRFIFLACFVQVLGGQISIHLMLRFIRSLRPQGNPDQRISIHLMLRFILQVWLLNSFQKSISIHLMLRFILPQVCLLDS